MKLLAYGIPDSLIANDDVTDTDLVANDGGTEVGLTATDAESMRLLGLVGQGMLQATDNGTDANLLNSDGTSMGYIDAGSARLFVWGEIRNINGQKS